MLVLLISVVLLFKPARAEWKGRDSIMLTTGVVSLGLVLTMVYSAVAKGNKQKDEKRPVESAEDISFDNKGPQTNLKLFFSRLENGK